MSFFLLCNDAVDPSRIDEFLETARQLIGIEHTIGATQYNGNTTRVDAFGLKIAMRLHCADGYEATVGEDDATFADDCTERAGETAHSTARQAADIANRAGAKRLALVHLSSRYAGDPSDHLAEARESFAGDAERVFVPDDGDELDLPYPDV